MNELRASVACTSYPVYAKYVSPHVKTVITPPLFATNSTQSQLPENDRRAWCHERLIEGTADIWLEVESVARPISLRHCPSTDSELALALVPAIRFGPAATGFAFRAEDVQKAHDISAAIIHSLQISPGATIALNAKYECPFALLPIPALPPPTPPALIWQVPR